MMAANYRHIGGGENRLGRHYSRFSAFWPPAAPADQSLALRKSQNAGSNRRSRNKQFGRVRADINFLAGIIKRRCPTAPYLSDITTRTSRRFDGEKTMESFVDGICN